MQKLEFSLLTLMLGACGGQIAQTTNRLTAKSITQSVESFLIPPTKVGGAWRRKIVLTHSDDKAGWIVQKTSSSEVESAESWKSVGVLDDNGEFIDEHISEGNAIYRIGEQWVSASKSAVKDVVIDNPDLCSRAEYGLLRIKAFRIVFKLPKAEDKFLLSGCKMQIESNQLLIENTIQKVSQIGNLHFADFDLKITAQNLQASPGVILDFRGAKGLDGAPARSGADGVTTPESVFLAKEQISKKMNPSLTQSLLKTGKLKNDRLGKQYLSLNPGLFSQVGAAGGRGQDANNGEAGGQGGTIVVYSPAMNLKVDVSGGEGGQPSNPGLGGNGGQGVKFYVLNQIKFGGAKLPPVKEFVFVGPPGARGPSGSAGRMGPVGPSGTSLWVPLENTSQLSGFYGENILNESL